MQFKKDLREGNSITKEITPAVLRKPGMVAVKTSGNAAMFREEALRMIGTCDWLQKNIRKALVCWKDLIREALHLNARVELARTYQSKATPIN